MGARAGAKRRVRKEGNFRARLTTSHVIREIDTLGQLGTDHGEENTALWYRKSDNGAEGTASLDASTYCFVSSIPGGVFSKDGIDICARLWLPEDLMAPSSVRAQKQRSSSA